ncbi:MAG: OsmC family protein [Gammaproteobacteria bacterium]
MTAPAQRPSIQDSAFPLVFPVAPDSFPGDSSVTTPDQATVRIRARALCGMQKEAVAQYGPTGATWRLVCDEGPWLNGTDLAPFPLAYFCAGLAGSYLSEYMAEAKERMIPVTRLELRLDNYFTMEGSALKGTMSAGVEPIQVRFDVDGDASQAELHDIADIAVNDRSPAGGILGIELESQFAVRANDEGMPDPGTLSASLMTVADPAGAMDDCRPTGDESLVENIIVKDESAAEPDAGDGAAGLKPEQKRTVHVSTCARVRGDGLKELAVQCIRPAGSRFLMLCDDSPDRGGQGRAPDPLTYLSCGVAFCYMTQIGRYAQIVRQKLHDFRIVQDTCFGFGPEQPPVAAAVETLVCLDTDELADASRRLVQMAEQTCYVHAAFRLPTGIELILTPDST